MFCNRFGLDLSPPTRDDVDMSNNNDMETDALWLTTGEVCRDDKPNGTGLCKYDNREIPDSGYDKYNNIEVVDGPVIVPYNQIGASIAQSALQ